MTSPRQTPKPLVVEPLPPELTSLPATIPALLQSRAAQTDDAVLIALGSGITFGEADRESARLAARLLAAGVGKGTRLGVLYPNGSPWLIAWLAAARIGALTVPLSTFAPGPELARALRHTDVHAVLMAGAFAGDSLAARLEAGLPGLAESRPELYLDAAPHLRWVCVDQGHSPLVAGAPGSGARVAGGRGRARGGSVGPVGGDHHFRRDRSTQIGHPHPRVAGAARSPPGGAASARSS